MRCGSSCTNVTMTQLKRSTSGTAQHTPKRGTRCSAMLATAVKTTRYAGTARRQLGAAAFLDALDRLRDDVKEASDNAEVGDLEDWGVGVHVDRHNRP